MSGYKCGLFVVGRICMSLIFVLSGLNKIVNWDLVKSMYATKLHALMSSPGVAPSMQNFLGTLIEYDGLVLAVAAIFELIGGLMVLTGIKPRVGAGLLVVFLIFSTIVVHPFWMVPLADQQIQYLMFMKNLAILGGLLLLMASPCPHRCNHNV